VDKVIVTALLVIASITGAVIAMNGMIPAISKSAHSLSEANEATAIRIGTNLEILGVASDSSDVEIEAWVKNVGIYSIGPVDSVEVFLITPGKGFFALPYDSGGESGSWTEYPVGSSWERGEILNLRISAPSGFPSGETHHVLRVATPNGVIAEESFERW
tara:strand:+ start:109 stop:588 length:480 start_codon:yes stop_codon:yes gene_type:complete